LNKKKLANFGPLTPEITWLMFNYLRSTVHVVCMLMHLSAGHVTAAGGISPSPLELSPNRT